MPADFFSSAAAFKKKKKAKRQKKLVYTWFINYCLIFFGLKKEKFFLLFLFKAYCWSGGIKSVKFLFKTYLRIFYVLGIYWKIFLKIANPEMQW